MGATEKILHNFCPYLSLKVNWVLFLVSG